MTIVLVILAAAVIMLVTDLLRIDRSGFLSATRYSSAMSAVPTFSPAAPRNSPKNCFIAFTVNY